MLKNNKRVLLYRNRLDDYLNHYYKTFYDEPQKLLFEAMEYSLLAGGKRLRSTLLFEFCRLCGGDWEKAIPLGAAIEMVHTYSLIHDDLPCLDNDDYRRGILTNHKVYGETVAVLAGDAMLTDAFSVASNTDLPADRVLEAIRILAGCAGSLGMVGGQLLDLQSEKRMLTEEEVLNIQSRKTGALIRAACAMGAVSAGASDVQYDAACQFAAGIGLAFQIRDDMLDVIGSRHELGKNVGSDEKKNTFVRLYGIDRCEELVQQYTQYALSALDCFEDTAFIRELSLHLIQRMK